jgi:hypothetical protein
MKNFITLWNDLREGHDPSKCAGLPTCGGRGRVGDGEGGEKKISE